MLAIVCWAAKPMIAASTAVEARIPVASFWSSVNWATAIAPTTRITTRTASRRRKRNRVLVERETCETAGGMEAKLPTAAPPDAIPGRREFPYSNWGPWMALLGVVMALAAAVVLSIPIAIVDNPADGEDLSDTALSLAQLGQELSFFLAPFAIAAISGASIRDAIPRLGFRRFRIPTALKWVGIAVGLYLVFVIAYVAIIGEPHQDNFKEDL